MGTRGLTCVALDGELKISQYGQWDHYPSGQGTTVYDFIKNYLTKPENLDNFTKNVRALKQLADAEVDEIWESAGADGSGFVGQDVSKDVKKKYFHLHRDCSAQILELVASGEVPAVQLTTEFAADSLFCEWVYVVDLDRKVLEVYKGFVQTPHTGQRFSHLQDHADHRAPEDKYYPVALLAEFPFAELPPTGEEFCIKLRPPDPES